MEQMIMTLSNIQVMGWIKMSKSKKIRTLETTLNNEEQEGVLKIIEEHREQLGDCMCRAEDYRGDSYCASMMLKCPYIDQESKSYTFRKDKNGTYLQAFYQCKYITGDKKWNQY